MYKRTSPFISYVIQLIYIDMYSHKCFSQIDHRLSAVGREISLVVQPADFIYEIRRLFKKLKNYKQFITQ